MLLEKLVYWKTLAHHLITSSLPKIPEIHIIHRWKFRWYFKLDDILNAIWMIRFQVAPSNTNVRSMIYQAWVQNQLASKFKVKTMHFVQDLNYTNRTTNLSRFCCTVFVSTQNISRKHFIRALPLCSLRWSSALMECLTKFIERLWQMKLFLLITGTWSLFECFEKLFQEWKQYSAFAAFLYKSYSTVK